MKKKIISSWILFIITIPAFASHVTGKVPAGINPQNAVVYLKGQFKGHPSPMKTKIDQKSLHFLPHVLVVTVGSTVTFLNSDTVNHNVFGVGAETFNLGTWPPGQGRNKTFTHPGEVALLCNNHQEMSAYILVLDTPYFSQPDASGQYRISDVPPGQYTLVIYQAGKGLVKNQIDVK